MYLVQFDKKNLYHICDDNSIIKTEEAYLEEGDKVQFIFKNKVHNGIILKKSDDRNSLISEKKKLEQASSKKTNIDLNKSSSLGKRKRIAAKKWSRITPKKEKTTKNDVQKKQKKILKTKENISSSESSEPNEPCTSKVQDISKLKKRNVPKINIGEARDDYSIDTAKNVEQNRNKLAPGDEQHFDDMQDNSRYCIQDDGEDGIQENYQDVIEENNQDAIQNNGNDNDQEEEVHINQENIMRNANINREKRELDDDDNIDYSVPGSQLIGRVHRNEQMIELRENIYCRKIILDSAIGGSRKASHIARRLIEGVFKPHALSKCTFTGQSVRSQGRERLQQTTYCLDGTAKKNIQKKKRLSWGLKFKVIITSEKQCHNDWERLRGNTNVQEVHSITTNTHRKRDFGKIISIFYSFACFK
ncbi:RNA polymerase II subunit 5-mediating protein homolog isoform X1 [Chelonus insularis]|uniref:RNA polymerase II subunit 5-mediating protein homolog isoform X1 n=1 Tax=Chelonus insularis TaxID=460826 RepID=UPI00158AC6B0|nr:RNA polymerase II subunit 5-mediating protein homolog isoform X1 [Chelonus insularis]